MLPNYIETALVPYDPPLFDGCLLREETVVASSVTLHYRKRRFVYFSVLAFFFLISSFCFSLYCIEADRIYEWFSEQLVLRVSTDSRFDRLCFAFCDIVTVRLSIFLLGYTVYSRFFGVLCLARIFASATLVYLAGTSRLAYVSLWFTIILTFLCAIQVMIDILFFAESVAHYNSRRVSARTSNDFRNIIFFTVYLIISLLIYFSSLKLF